MELKIGLVLNLFILLLFLNLFAKQSFAQESPPRPKNIIYIMMDDADYFDVSYNNNLLTAPDAKTPRIDALRKNGKAFTQFHDASTICTPTRASVLTGTMPLQFGAKDAWIQIDRVIQSNAGLSGLPSNIPQIGKIFTNAGFATAHHGKWHVGMSRSIYKHPALGFADYSYYNSIPGDTRQDWHGEFEFVRDEGSNIIDVDYLDTYFADQVITSINNNVVANKRFYINYWPLSPHFPWAPPRNFDNSETNFDLSTDRGKVLAMMYSIDKEIGRIVDKLDELGQLNDTLIMITSDNGGQQKVRNATSTLRGSKGNLFEAGILVPFVAHWPNGIPANSVSNQFMTTADLLPTLMDLVGVDPTPLYSTIDGRSMASAFLSNNTISHNPVVWEINGNPKRTGDIRAQSTYAIRDGNYKLIKVESRNDITDPTAYFLYNIAQDPNETNNLRAANPTLLNDMKIKLLNLRKSASQYRAFPSSATSMVNIPFDPRLDVNSKDMTFAATINIPAGKTLTSSKNIYYKLGSQRISLLNNKTINWRITGSDNLNNSVSEVLVSPVLSSGEHKLVFTIKGFKGDTLRAEMYIDGTLVASTDSISTGMVQVWSTVSNASLGDADFTVSNVQYYNNYFWLDELKY
jgi:arylsulfatase A-like enzyme